MYILYIIPALNNLAIITCAADHGANNGRQLLDGYLDTPGGKFSENHYRLDENGAERLGTPHIVFISPTEPIKGIGSVSIGKIDVFGPMFVCTSKYRGWSAGQVPRVVLTLQYIINTSSGGDYNMKPKTLDEMLKEYGNKS